MTDTTMARFIAELINGGDWDDPNFYTEEQKELWRKHAEKIEEHARYRMVAGYSVVRSLDSVRQMTVVYGDLPKGISIDGNIACHGSFFRLLDEASELSREEFERFIGRTADGGE